MRTGQLAVFGPGDTITINGAVQQESRTPALDVVILGGAPIREPIAMYGPFVMNTRQEVMDAFTDFQAGRLGSIPASYVPHGAVRGETGQDAGRLTPSGTRGTAMSNLDRRPAAQVLGGLEATAAGPALDLLPGKEVLLGESTRVRRLLPTLGRRLVGAWAFVDHYGPDDVAAGAGMQVAPHPHTGLQTVSWLLEGEVHHRDSLGSDVAVRPGPARADDGRARHRALRAVAGRAIRGSCTAPSCGSRCPTPAARPRPAFEHHATLPGLTSDGLTTTVLMGSFGGATSPGTAYTPLVGVDLDAGRGCRRRGAAGARLRVRPAGLLRARRRSRVRRWSAARCSTSAPAGARCG